MPERVEHVGDARLLGRVRWRLVLVSAGSTLLVLLLLGSALYVALAASLAASGTAQLESRASETRSFLADDHGPPPADDERFGQFLFGGPNSGTIQVLIDESGQLVQQPREPHASEDLPVSDSSSAALAAGRDLRDATVGETPVRVLSERVELDGTPYVIQVLQDRSTEVRTLSVLLVVLVVGGLAAVVAAAALGFFYAGRALVPIRESLRRQREFAADASHELRTPLTVIRSGVDFLRRNRQQPAEDVGDTLDDIDAEVGHLASLVDDLLLLARSDSGTVQLERLPVDLADVAGAALAALRTRAAERGVQLRLDAAPVTLTGDPDRLRQLVAILVDNAIRHSPPGATVTVHVGADGRPSVVVEDEGSGIREEDLPHVFDRFWRAADAPEGGTGLGLAIAAWIAEHHGGSIRAANRADRSGARFEVALGT
jgi:two-component system sensor histidine kinase CiaH